MTGKILYLHGFQSSPLSYKAQLISGAIAEKNLDFTYFCPQLPVSPAESAKIAEDIIKGCGTENLTVIGSSLGGYYAGWCAEKFGCRAVLLNPVVDPWKIKILDDIPDRDDLQVREWLNFREKYRNDLDALRVRRITKPERYFLIAAKGDELLDWQLMRDQYRGCRQIIREGGDHSLTGFDVYLDELFRFCGAAI